MASVMVIGTIRIEGGPPQECTIQGQASPLVIWGGKPPNYVDIGGPADQPYPDQGLPGQQPHPDQSLPGPQPHPSHPIVIIPPGAIDGEHPEHPIYLPVYPTHPIELPPEEPAPEGFQWVYTPAYGWVLDPQGGGKPQPVPQP